jgi:putative oxidoreductase
MIGLGCPLQRLFSTFPDGWPGFGLLLLRVGAAIGLIYFGVVDLAGAVGQSLNVALRTMAIAGGLLLLLGLWTPVAGTVVAADEVWSAFSLHFSQQDDRGLHLLLAVLAAGVAMLGPGAWSVDARLFGRRRFKIDGRTRPK